MPMKIDQKNPFIACWNKSNARLNFHSSSVVWNTAAKIKKIIFYIPNCMIAASINPRSESRFYPSPKLNTNHGSFAKEIVTPDQVHLSAHIYLVEKANSDTPTVILFNPLGANDSIHFGLKTRLTERKCNVVTFNYRGLGSTRRAEDLVIDGESIYQYVTRELDTQKNKVHFYGFSLGGALAAQVKALHPESEGKYVGDRPFRSVFSLITENCCIEIFGSLIKRITAFVSSIFLAYPVYLLGWEWEGSTALNQLKGDKRVVYHPNDYLVPFEASLASRCSPKQVIRLDPTVTGPSTHFSTLEKHLTAEGARAANIVADFLSR